MIFRTSRSEQKRIAYRKIPFDGTNLMQQLLESEGIVVVENQIIDFEKHFWNRVSEQ
jgi:methylated-DNA-protein-cysteine methyltransferase-like protein